LGVFQLQFQLSTAVVGLAPSSYLIALYIQVNSGKHTRFCFTVKNPVASNVGIYIFCNYLSCHRSGGLFIWVDSRVLELIRQNYTFVEWMG
jgi:hypothetical protein